ncbi:MAG: CoxE, partial [Gemmatimonadetes bacterium]|nr:CoxE [Gemmatimonadota bacterium]
MIKRLVEFARLLRQSGVRVSMAETLDAAEVLRHAQVTERPAFKASLRTTLVKTREDIPAFDEAFERFFLVQVGEDGEELD